MESHDLLKGEIKIKNKKSNNILKGIIALLAILFIVSIFTDGFNFGSKDVEIQGAVPAQQAPPIDMNSLIENDEVKGNPNAPVTIVEWSDYECPYCAKFYSQTLEQIDEKYDTRL